MSDGTQNTCSTSNPYANQKISMDDAHFLNNMIIKSMSKNKGKAKAKTPKRVSGAIKPKSTILKENSSSKPIRGTPIMKSSVVVSPADAQSQNNLTNNLPGLSRTALTSLSSNLKLRPVTAGGLKKLNKTSNADEQLMSQSQEAFSHILEAGNAFANINVRTFDKSKSFNNNDQRTLPTDSNLVLNPHLVSKSQRSFSVTKNRNDQTYQNISGSNRGMNNAYQNINVHQFSHTGQSFGNNVLTGSSIENLGFLTNGEKNNLDSQEPFASGMLQDSENSNFSVNPQDLINPSLLQDQTQFINSDNVQPHVQRVDDDDTILDDEDFDVDNESHDGTGSVADDNSFNKTGGGSANGTGNGSANGTGEGSVNGIGVGSGGGTANGFEHSEEEFGDRPAEHGHMQVSVNKEHHHGPNCCELCSAKLDLILYKQNELLLLLEANKNNERTSGPLRPMNFDLLPHLPVGSTQDLLDLNDQLDDPNVKHQFENKISLLIASTLSTTIAQIMSAIMKNDVANRVTWSQLKSNSQKEFVICDFSFVTTVTDYLQKETAFKDKKEILDCMGDWTRRASDRIANEKKKEMRRSKQNEGRVR